MSRKIEFRPAARVEFDEAADRYETIRSGLGVEFTAEIDACVARAAEQPRLYARVHRKSGGSRLCDSRTAFTFYLRKNGSSCCPFFTEAGIHEFGSCGSNNCRGRRERRK
jgi:hypothetical protein